MSVHVLLNLLNEMGKRDKMRGMPSILSLFRNEFNKFNNTAARMLDSIYHIILKFIKIAFGVNLWVFSGSNASAVFTVSAVFFNLRGPIFIFL